MDKAAEAGTALHKPLTRLANQRAVPFERIRRQQRLGVTMCLA